MPESKVKLPTFQLINKRFQVDSTLCIQYLNKITSRQKSVLKETQIYRNSADHIELTTQKIRKLRICMLSLDSQTIQEAVS